MTDKVQKILSEIATRKLCTMDEHMAFYNDKAKEDYRFLSEIEELIKALQEEPTHFATSEPNEDIEQYARNEADKFASKEYEYHNDIRLLSKGFYWGCKAGAKWQEQQIKKSAIYGIVAGRVKDEVFVASRWFKDDKLKPAEDIKLIIIKD